MSWLFSVQRVQRGLAVWSLVSVQDSRAHNLAQEYERREEDMVKVAWAFACGIAVAAILTSVKEVSLVLSWRMLLEIFGLLGLGVPLLAYIEEVHRLRKRM